jgi:hypothetical protein
MKMQIVLWIGMTALLGNIVVAAETAVPPKKLTQFQEANFGVRFSHPAAVETTYNPHGGAGQVRISYNGRPIGGLAIRPAPTGSITNFIESGKQYYRTKYGASSVEYALYENPQHYKFHSITAKIVHENANYVIERFVCLRVPSQSTTPEEEILEKISGAFSFEFMYPEAEYKQMKPEIKILTDTFELVDVSKRPPPSK